MCHPTCILVTKTFTCDNDAAATDDGHCVVVTLFFDIIWTFYEFETFEKYQKFSIEICLYVESLYIKR